jgi:hypothetical protein
MQEVTLVLKLKVNQGTNDHPANWDFRALLDLAPGEDVEVIEPVEQD